MSFNGDREEKEDEFKMSFRHFEGQVCRLWKREESNMKTHVSGLDDWKTETSFFFFKQNKSTLLFT